MLRFVLLVIFLMALPTVLYMAYVRFRSAKELDQILADAPLIPLTGAGVVLTAAVLLVYLQFNRNDPSGRYVPPTYKDGVIVPGHVE